MQTEPKTTREKQKSLAFVLFCFVMLWFFITQSPSRSRSPSLTLLFLIPTRSELHFAINGSLVGAYFLLARTYAKRLCETSY